MLEREYLDYLKDQMQPETHKKYTIKNAYIPSEGEIS